MAARLRRNALFTSSLAVALAALAMTANALAGASAGCRAPGRHPFPSVTGLTASRASCATARSVTEHVQGVWETTNGTLPGWFRTSAHGPWWHCRYRRHGEAARRYHTASCTSGRATVKMRLGA